MRGVQDLLRILCGVIALVGPATVTTGQEAKKSIDPPAVFVHSVVVRDELELIRLEIGRRKEARPEIGVTGADPREVFFQALTLFGKAERLCFEHTRERAKPPQIPPGEILPKHVFGVVDLALQRIRRVKATLGIVERVKVTQRDPTHTPSHVLRSIVQANRQLNLMLDQQYSPSDVFQQVTVAVGYTSRLLERFPGADRIPKEPEFAARKRPPDVYRRLVGCFEQVRSIGTQSGLKMLDLKTEEAEIEAAEPSDVYDMASLIVSELTHLHAQLPEAGPPRKVFYPGRKFPSHVFQRAGLLEAQLTELGKRVEKDPKWLQSLE